jgi:hypothetical protein
MDVSAPGFGLPAASDAPVFVEGALGSAAWKSTGAVLANFIQQLRDLLNLPAELLKANAAKLIVAPPLYGRWHAAQSEIGAGSQPWFSDLNSDPRLRVAAGTGTLAVQNEQQSLLASAWAQVDSIRAANQALRWKQFALFIASRLHDKIFVAPNDTKIVRFAAPVLARIIGSPVTLRKLIADSPIAEGILEPQFRRLARPLGPRRVRVGGKFTGEIRNAACAGDAAGRPRRFHPKRQRRFHPGAVVDSRRDRGRSAQRLSQQHRRQPENV